MRIAVLGGTGMVGSRIVAEAASRGHQVTAVSRSGEDPKLDGVSARSADAADPATLRSLAGEHDVIVCALGPSRAPGADHRPFLDSIGALIDNAGSARLVVVGGAGSLVGADGARLVDNSGFPDAYKPEALTQAASLEQLRDRATAVDWTYLSPAPEIAPGERTGRYAVGGDSPVGARISAEDYAVALVDEVETPAHPQQRFTVAN